MCDVQRTYTLSGHHMLQIIYCLFCIHYVHLHCVFLCYDPADCLKWDQLGCLMLGYAPQLLCNL